MKLNNIKPMNKEKINKSAVERLEKEIQYYEKQKLDLLAQQNALDSTADEYEIQKKHLMKRIEEVENVLKEVKNVLKGFNESK